jgi:hypothetical protein
MAAGRIPTRLCSQIRQCNAQNRLNRSTRAESQGWVTITAGEFWGASLLTIDRRKPPTTDQLEGRVIVLEAMVMAAVALAAKGPTNFSPELIIEMLNGVKCAIGGRLIKEGVAQDCIAEAQRYIDEVLAQFWQSLKPKLSQDRPIDGPAPYDHTAS